MKRIDMHRLQELVRLHRMGTGAHEVARLLKMSPNTERDYRRALAKAGLLDGSASALPELEVLKASVLEYRPLMEPPQQVSTLQSYFAAIEAMLEHGAGPRAIFDKLRLEHADFAGSLSAVKRACTRLHGAQGVRAEDVALRVETPPGRIAQVDFGYAGELFDPLERRTRRAWFFVMVLAHSRHLFARIVFDQKSETWLELHVEAFEEFGGVPEIIVPDNLKAAVIRAAFAIDDQSDLHLSYRELGRHYGFKVDPTPPRDPDKKGKVESAVKYVKNNFFVPRRDERDAGILNRELDRWRFEIAGLRVHGTTQRRPLEAFHETERATLMPLPALRFEPVIWRRARVHRDTHVVVGRAYYSVPWSLVGHEVLVRISGGTVAIYASDQRIATHELAAPGMRRTLPAHLPSVRSDYRERTQEHWQERAEKIGAEVGVLVQEIFESDDVLYQLRTVQAIVRHLEAFPAPRARAAAARARYFRNYTYGAIKRILREALDLDPLPNTEIVLPPWPTAPRFARDIRNLFEHTKETLHEPN